MKNKKSIGNRRKDARESASFHILKVIEVIVKFKVS